jgi:hypothetical protein
MSKHANLLALFFGISFHEAMLAPVSFFMQKAIVGADWHQTLDQILIRNLRQSRKYDGASV